MDYEINKDTLVIVPMTKNKCKIIESNNEYNLHTSGFKVIEHSCEYFGSSFEGRQNATKSLIHAKYKMPIIVEESQKIIVFPTTSFDSENCIWIALNNIADYKASSNNKYSIIKFKNGNTIELNISFGSLQNQILRATRLQSVMQERINKIQ